MESTKSLAQRIVLLAKRQLRESERIRKYAQNAIALDYTTRQVLNDAATDIQGRLYETIESMVENHKLAASSMSELFLELPME